ncbi:MAG TPA: amino acid permease [Pseudonocardiaceae bacterium]|nr:amino acid permease [Pseudonocardiaceae bacterium]
MADGDGKRGTLTTARVVFLVIAAAAPLAAMVGNVPLALVYGNGAGLPAAFLLATVVLLCFSVGYAAMSRHVVNTGAFYTYVARGLGRPPALGAAYLAVLSYTCLTIGLAGAFGYFVQLVLHTEGVRLAWEWPAAVAVVVVGLLGYRSVDLSAKVLGTLMVAEFAILAVFDVGVVAHKGTAALPATSFSPHTALAGSLGVGMMFALTSFIGFESAALYGEETKDPRRSVPRATYLAVASIGIFYLLTVWVTVGAVGAGNVRAAASGQLGNLLFNQATVYVGQTLSDLMAVFLCTSVLASMLAVHNAASRYLFALGRERVVPRVLGRYHPRHLSPHLGSLTVSVLTTVVVVLFAVAGLDPYLTLATSMIGLATLGIIALQAMAAVAVVVYFARRRTEPWAVAGAVVGAVGLTTALVLVVSHFREFANTGNPFVLSVPWLLVVAVVGGVLAACYLRFRRPSVYTGLAASTLRARERTLPRPAAWTRRYCLVGAGPAGLVMARALLAEGVPFDWYERHSDIGGIWDRDNPGSPMYDSAHFISSKYTSGFVGQPMPSSYPDYPSWRQIRDYIREFANAYGLAERVNLGTAVVSAEPGADGWDVTLSTGTRRRYAGVIAATGVTWHPSLPTWPGQDEFTGEIRHSVTYGSPAEFAGRRVLIVGAGNSGVDIACDAATHADQAFLSVRRGYRFIPKHIAGIPTDALLAGVIEPPRGLVVPADPTRFIDAIVGDLTRFGLPKPDHDLLASHPLMNTQVLHHLGHGDLTAKPDVVALTPTGARFTDGSHEDVDLILAATGYQYLLPFLDPELLTWRGGRPQLYLNIFDRKLDGLAVLGFVEFADAAYRRFEEMAQLIVLDITARELGGETWTRWQAAKADHHPDLTGGKSYLDSPRHAAYVDSATYQSVLAELREKFGLPTLTESSYPVPRREELSV